MARQSKSLQNDAIPFNSAIGMSSLLPLVFLNSCIFMIYFSNRRFSSSIITWSQQILCWTKLVLSRNNKPHNNIEIVLSNIVIQNPSILFLVIFWQMLPQWLPCWFFSLTKRLHMASSRDQHNHSRPFHNGTPLLEKQLTGLPPQTAVTPSVRRSKQTELGMSCVAMGHLIHHKLFHCSD